MESQKHDHAKMFECKFRYAKKCYKRGLHKYSSFPWFLNPNITYIFYRAKLHKSGLYHNFWLDCTSDLNWVFLNCILIALFRDTPLARFFVMCPGTGASRYPWKCSLWTPNPGRLCTPVKSYGSNMIQVTSPHEFCLAYLIFVRFGTPPHYLGL